MFIWMQVCNTYGIIIPAHIKVEIDEEIKPEEVFTGSILTSLVFM